MGMVVMSKRELNRLDVLARLDSDRLTARAAAELMAITPRQAYRLLRRYRDGGASAVANQPSSREQPLAGCGSMRSLWCGSGHACCRCKAMKQLVAASRSECFVIKLFLISQG